MKKILALCLLSVAFACVAYAQEVNISTTAKSTFLGSNSAVFSDQPVQQTELDIQWKSGFYINLFGSTGYNFRKDYDKEFDLGIGKRGTFAKGKYRYSVSGNWLALVGGDQIGFYGEVSRPIKVSKKLAVEPFSRVEAYAPLQGKKIGPKPGALFFIGNRVTVPLNDKFTLNGNIQVNRDTGLAGFDQGYIGRGNISLTYQVNKNLSFTGKFENSAPITKMNDGRKNTRVYSLGTNWRF